jgi:S-DNA-T family DNA segregation ATPase FtsK/SpoIIIE
VALAAAGWLTLLTWSAADPSLTHATPGLTRNFLGPVGAIVADLALQMLGFTAVIAFLGPAWAGAELIIKRRIAYPRRRLAWFGLALLALAGALSSISPPAAWPINHGLGGAGGDFVFTTVATVIGTLLPRQASALAGLALFAGGMSLLSAALALGQRDLAVLAQSKHWSRPIAEPVLASAPIYAEPDRHDGHDDFPDHPHHPTHRHSHAVHRDDAVRPREPKPERPFPPQDAGRGHAPGFDQATDMASQSIAARFAPSQAGESPKAPRAGAATAVLGGLMSFRGKSKDYRRPSLNILKRPPPQKPGAEHTQPVLRGSARLLEDVLGDFGVKGEIKGIHPGPVVTLFELEPQRGTKASRIIALADDIARSMSAVSARVAPIPGRNVIGIELPNVRRETVFLRELLESEAWRSSEAQLPIALGKGIGGEPIIAALARMPHLLVAGTTGSGKSVGVNGLILSLLFRHSPEDCRFLMIDPKMLELSVYNGIPHLLAPVVTDPHRAAAALGWAVSEMEERYKRMAEAGVRNIEMFNVRAKNAKKRGAMVGRTVQTGFDPKTGEAVYVQDQREPQPMPHLVIVVDEFADLMAVAGKEIEGVVQRLAQMARAAGIHLVMATQRPSVDVVTGTIKANFPARIAFRVASKVDSRTIINEQGAEQLLGAGDMLFSPGSGQLLRVHAPFVSDEEVESVAAALREQGEPNYIDALQRHIEITDQVDGGGVTHTPVDSADDLFDRAVAIVHRDGKASTSYLQRRLSIGYNRAADLIERMEAEGIVSPADHSGRRRVLIGAEAQSDGAD